jgi:large subunit ribosomal protein L13
MRNGNYLMDTLSKTYLPTNNKIERKCFLIDAKGLVLGRLATRIAMILMGKDEPFYTPHMECGDQVIITNADQIRVTGRKAETKTYDHYSGYPGGRRVITFEKMKALHPEKIISEAVRRMLPDNRMRDRMMKRLYVYQDGKHPHQAQKPETLVLS